MYVCMYIYIYRSVNSFSCRYLALLGLRQSGLPVPKMTNRLILGRGLKLLHRDPGEIAAISAITS